MTLIGAGIARPDAVDKVRGEARFVDDLAFPGMLFAKVIRSPHPHARILRVDLTDVLAHPGVVVTVVAEEVPGENVVHVIFDDQPALARDVVRYIGEPVALLAAEDRRSAEEAARKAKVDYEPLPAVVDPEEALLPGAPVVAVSAAAEKGNLFNAFAIRNGDVDEGLRQADVVVHGEYRTGYQEHAYIETQGAIAVPDEHGAMAVYGSLQCPFYVQGAVAKALGLPLAKVRIVQTATGGAFGGKEDVPSHLCTLVALLAWKARRPVKLVLDRREDVLTTSKRHPAVVRYTSGATKDGRLTAVRVEFVYNAGAYQTLSSAVLWRGVVTAPGPYRVPHVDIVGRSAATNTVPCGAFRGFGSPQVIFPHEAQMDLLAEKLGIDRVEIRRRNALQPGDVSPVGQPLDASVGAAETVERAGQIAGWEKRLRAVEEHNARSPDRRRGLGVASVVYGVGMGCRSSFLDKAGAYLKLEADGSVTVAVGTVEMGQGHSVVLLQIAAEALGIPLERIHLAPADTSRVPDSGPTVASRGTILSALAIQDGARRLRERIEEVAASLGIHVEDASRELPRIARAFFLQTLDPAVEGWAHAEPTPWDPEKGQRKAYFAYAYATHVAEVEVDPVTGEVSVEDFIAVHDSGKVLNRQTASGQVEGGIAQGIGYAVTEEIATKGGELLARGLTTYRIPTVRDVAPHVEVEFVEALYAGGPHGAKGLGEVPLMASHAAVALAVAHAIGRPVAAYPLSPERTRALVNASR